MTPPLSLGAAKGEQYVDANLLRVDDLDNFNEIRTVLPNAISAEHLEAVRALDEREELVPYLRAILYDQKGTSQEILGCAKSGTTTRSTWCRRVAPATGSETSSSQRFHLLHRTFEEFEILRIKVFELRWQHILFRLEQKKREWEESRKIVLGGESK
jgi:hypothetical protein